MKSGTRGGTRTPIHMILSHTPLPIGLRGLINSDKYGAGGQIRTDDGITPACLQGKCFGPLSHTSIFINIIYELLRNNQNVSWSIYCCCYLYHHSQVMALEMKYAAFMSTLILFLLGLFGVATGLYLIATAR